MPRSVLEHVIPPMVVMSPPSSERAAGNPNAVSPR
jgi:hypothetical protein